MWESNPPKKLQTPYAGFEDQRAHQNSSTPIKQHYVLYIIFWKKSTFLWKFLINKF